MDVKNAARQSEELTETDLKHIARNIDTVLSQKRIANPLEDDTKHLECVFGQVYQAAKNQLVAASYRVAAWDAICAVIKRLSALKPIYSHEDISIDHYWSNAFRLYIYHGQNARPKSSKQLLVSLSAALGGKHPPKDFRRIIVGTTTGVLSRDEDPSYAKAGLHALTHFLRKDILALRDVLEGMPTKFVGEDTCLSKEAVQDLLRLILSVVERGDFGSTVAQALSAILDKAEQLKLSTNAAAGWEMSLSALWVQPLRAVIQSSASGISLLRAHVLPVLFQRNVQDYLSFMYEHGLEQLTPESKPINESIAFSDEAILFAALRIGKETGLLYETIEQQVSTSASNIYIPLRYIASLLFLSSREARLTGLSCLLSSHATTRPIPKKVFWLLKRSLPQIFTDTDAHFRGEVFSLIENFVDRLQAITTVLYRKDDTTFTTTWTSGRRQFSTGEEYRAFLVWLLRFLSASLNSTSSYQTHISALKVLAVLSRSGLDERVPRGLRSKYAQRSGDWPFRLSIMTPDVRHLLVTLLVDPFDDVRQASATVLSYFVATVDVEEHRRIYTQLTAAKLSVEGLMLSTGRADQADGLAHMHSLLHAHQQTLSPCSESEDCQILLSLVKSVERVLGIAQSSAATAVDHYPLHGLLTSTRYVVVQHSSITGECTTRLQACLRATWDAVKLVLCNDAPEGYDPEHIEITSQGSTKDVLSYCWRALKESSLLLGVLITRRILPAAATTSLSNLCFTQLAELRHRGAFSTVAQTWVACCVEAATYDEGRAMQPLELWYNRVLDMLEQRTTINTRRSAGLPSLLVGVLIGDRSDKLMAKAFADLSRIARRPLTSAETHASSLPQVHAMNCMKDILKSTRLGERSERHVSDALLLAAESLQSNVWAVRNCGLMLFRAVLDRLLGTNEGSQDESTPSQRTSRCFDEQLSKVVLDLLGTWNNRDHYVSSHDGIFLALHMLQCIEVNEATRESALGAVVALTASPSWHVRDKAARTYASMMNVQDINLEIRRLLTASTSGNSSHGALLCIKYLLVRLSKAASLDVRTKRLLEGPSSTISDSPIATACLDIVGSAGDWLNNDCSIIRALYIDNVLDAASAWDDKHQRSVSSSIEGTVFRCLDLDEALDAEKRLEDMLATRATRFLADALLRRSLARAFAYSMERSGASRDQRFEKLLALVLRLAAGDSDSCAAIFRLHERTRPASSPKISYVVKFEAALKILQGDYDMALKCETQHWLLEMPWLGVNVARLSLLSDMAVSALSCPGAPADRACDQRHLDQWLQLQAATLEHRMSGKLASFEDVEAELSTWILACRRATRNIGPHTREAAAFAIGRLRETWQYIMAVPYPPCCNLCITVYDLLNDDDEELRCVAAHACSWILSTSTCSRLLSTLEPCEARQRLLEVILQHCSSDTVLIEEAFSRAFGLHQTSCQPPADQLRYMLTNDTSLFAEERQNLYVDDAKETKLWSRVVLRFDIAAIPRALVQDLGERVLEGLNALKMQASSGSGGPISWASWPDVFILGLQIIFGVEALLSLADRGGKLQVRPSTLKAKLIECYSVFKHEHVSPLWTREIERVLGRAVLPTIERQCELMQWLKCRLKSG